MTVFWAFVTWVVGGVFCIGLGEVPPSVAVVGGKVLARIRPRTS